MWSDCWDTSYRQGFASSGRPTRFYQIILSLQGEMEMEGYMKGKDVFHVLNIRTCFRAGRAKLLNALTIPITATRICFDVLMRRLVICTLQQVEIRIVSWRMNWASNVRRMQMNTRFQSGNLKEETSEWDFKGIRGGCGMEGCRPVAGSSEHSNVLRVVCRLLDLLLSSQNGLLLRGANAAGWPWHRGGHLNFRWSSLDFSAEDGLVHPSTSPFLSHTMV
jgi:hypothetical protein